jgi:hypothetical protein
VLRIEPTEYQEQDKTLKHWKPVREILQESGKHASVGVTTFYNVTATINVVNEFHFSFSTSNTHRRNFGMVTVQATIFPHIPFKNDKTNPHVFSDISFGA